MGAIAFLNPVQWLSVPPLAGLEGQGHGSMGGGGPQGGVSHTLPPASSSVYGTHPHAFVCPYFHQRGCSRGGHPAVDCHGCCGACSSSLPAFPAAGFWFGRPRGCGVRSSTCPCSLASWTFPTVAWYPSSLFSCQSVWGIGWPPSFFGRRILRFLCIRNLVASCALWLMAALTDSMHCASVCPRPSRSSLDLWLLYPFFIPWVSVCVVTGTTGSSRRHPWRPSSGISGLSCPFVASGGSWSTRSSPFSPSPVVLYLGMVIDAQTFMASPSPDRVSRLRSPSDEFCPPQRLLLAYGSHFWGCCPLCHIWFQVAACG